MFFKSKQGAIYPFKNILCIPNVMDVEYVAMGDNYRFSEPELWIKIIIDLSGKNDFVYIQFNTISEKLLQLESFENYLSRK